MLYLNRRTLTSVMAVVVFAGALGCGGDLASGNTNGTEQLNGGEQGDNEQTGNSDDPTTASSLQIVSREPTIGQSDVERDHVIRIVFSHALDVPLPDDAVVVENAASGERVAGRTIADGRALLFMPTRFAANTTHNVRINTTVTAGDRTLDTPEQFRFTTGERTSGNTRVPPTEYAPLGPGRQVALGQMPEYALVWTDSSDTHFALEDPPYNPVPMLNRNAPDAEGLGPIANLPVLQGEKLPVVAQLDDDGAQEVAIFSADATGAINLVITDHTASGVTYKAPNLMFALADSFEAAAGDFDRDGRDELLLGISRQGERIRYYLVEYDPQAENYVIAFSGTIASEGSTAAQYVRVSAGDIDHDGMAEAVLAWHVVSTRESESSNAYYVVHDDAKHGMAEMFPYRAVREGIRWQNNCHHAYIDLTTGNVDKDGADEIVFSIYEPQYVKRNFWNTTRQCQLFESLLVADNIDNQNPVAPRLQTLADQVSLGYFWYPKAWVVNGALINRHRPVLETGDLDGAPGDEILLHNMIFKVDVDPSTGRLQVPSGWPKEIPASIVDFRPTKARDHRPADLSPNGITTDVKIGDVDGDLKQDVVLLRKAGGRVWVDHFDLDADDAAHVVFRNLQTNLQRSSSYNAFAGRPLLALPNVDSDSMIVEQTGHDVYLGDNIILAVLAAAPCSEALGQDIGACATEFAQGTSDSRSHGVYVNASAGVTAGFEWKPELNIPFVKAKLASVEFEVAIGVEGSYQHSWATEVSEQVSYSAGADNNLVVFKTHVYDRYTYRIVAHPDPDQINTSMSINVPTGYRTFAVSQDFYNASNGEQIDIDETIIGVQPGALDSYPQGSTAARAIATGDGSTLVAISTEATAAPEGPSNATGMELGIANSQSDEFSIGAYVNASLKGCGPDANGWNPSVCVGVEGGVSAGYAHAHEWSSETTFAGSLAGLPEAQFAENRYGAGLFAYQKTIADDRTGENQSFVVVSYFVQ